MDNKSKGRYVLKVVLLLAYLALATYVLFFAEGFGRGAESEFRYNLIPFHEIKRYFNYWDVVGAEVFCLNIFGNIILFIPLGFFIPALFTGKGHYPLEAIIICFLFSVAVEVIQLVTRLGSCDVDDVILNTLGGIIGYIIYRIYSFIRRRSYGRKKT